MTLRIAVPNKGRLQDPTFALLRQAGLAFERTDRALSIPVRNVDVELLAVRAEDVCELVDDGVAALGITGYDLLAESGRDLTVTAELGYGRCRLAVAVPTDSTVATLEDLDGARVATSHPATVQRMLADKGIGVDVVPLRGSVEVAPRLGVADAIADLVSSGSTLLVNGLRPIATLLSSQAVLVAQAGAAAELESQAVATMLQAVVVARRKRYLLMNAPAEAVDVIEEIIPGVDAPSVMPLAHNGKVAIHSVVDADDVWTVLPQLQSAGATGILVLPIEKMIP